MPTTDAGRPPPPSAPPVGAPVPPAGGAPGQRIVVGPRVRQQMAAQVERLMPLVLLALLETSGVPEGQGYRLVLGAAHLEPAGAPVGTEGH